MTPRPSSALGSALIRAMTRSATAGARSVSTIALGVHATGLGGLATSSVFPASTQQPKCRSDFIRQLINFNLCVWRQQKQFLASRDTTHLAKTSEGLLKD